MPATVKGIETYLGTGLIHGIGPGMARRIVQHFGEHTLEVIEKETDRLAEVPGIGPARIAMIRKAWEEQQEIRNVMLFLREHGVSVVHATRIFRQYGDRSVAVVTES